MEGPKKCVFLDRDGVLNYDSPDYVFDVSEFRLYEETAEVVKQLKSSGFLLIVMTNQAGLSRGLYSREQMQACHEKLQREVGGSIDDIYYSPYHPSVTKSLSRKPGTLMFEKAIAKWNIDKQNSWMVGDKESDILPAIQLGLSTIGISRSYSIESSEYTVDSLAQALPIILSK